MHSPDLRTASRPSTPYHCTNCSRSFIAYKNSAAENIVCACGAVLEPGSLPRGVYELCSSVPEDSRVTKPALPSSSPETEADLGYGRSHGYGPAHGGPTGPGDAPAAGEGEAGGASRDEPGAAKPRAGN